MKLWDVKKNECIETFDEHKDRLWAIAVKEDGKELIAGGEDSMITIWKENSKVVLQEMQKELDEIIFK
jgi:U3 small nucleolar RNA-associated protein 13